MHFCSSIWFSGSSFSLSCLFGHLSLLHYSLHSPLGSFSAFSDMFMFLLQTDLHKSVITEGGSGAGWQTHMLWNVSETLRSQPDSLFSPEAMAVFPWPFLWDLQGQLKSIAEICFTSSPFSPGDNWSGWLVVKLIVEGDGKDSGLFWNWPQWVKHEISSKSLAAVLVSPLMCPRGELIFDPLRQSREWSKNSTDITCCITDSA